MLLTVGLCSPSSKCVNVPALGGLSTIILITNFRSKFNFFFFKQLPPTSPIRIVRRSPANQNCSFCDMQYEPLPSQEDAFYLFAVSQGPYLLMRFILIFHDRLAKTATDTFYSHGVHCSGTLATRAASQQIDSTYDCSNVTVLTKHFMHVITSESHVHIIIGRKEALGRTRE